MSKKNPTRRSFLEVVLGGGIVAVLGAIFYPIYKYIIPPRKAEADLSQLKLPFKRADIEAEPKKAKYFKYGRTLGIIFLTEAGELKALSATCTHLDCTVQYRPDWDIIWCACHNGKYDLDGRNISGPPPRPLTRFEIKETDDGILVSQQEA